MQLDDTKEIAAKSPAFQKLRGTAHIADLPNKLLNAQEASDALTKQGLSVSAYRLTELADGFFVPHFRVDGGAPYFSLSDVRQWVRANLIKKINGQPLSAEYRVLTQPMPAEESRATFPAQLFQIWDKLIVQQDICTSPGVYFLCDGGKVTYVGQSICAGARIAMHWQTGKVFQRAYILPLPISDLDQVEAAFIKALAPRDNIAQPAVLDGDRVLMEIGFPVEKACAPCAPSV